MIHQWLDRQFRLRARGTSVQREAFAGFTTFATMAYIIIVNPTILAEAGMDFGAVMVATILSAITATLVMGLYAGYPFALAPGMGLNAFFAYSLVIKQGVSWQIALGASFWAGVVFLILNIFGFRDLLIRALPRSLRIGMTGGIGLFLAFIGLQNIAVIVPDPTTVVTLGAVNTPEVLYATFGLVVSTALVARRVPGAILISILLTWIAALATGDAEWKGVFSLPPSPLPTLGQLDLWGALSFNALSIVAALTFIAVFDAAGTVTSLAEMGGFYDQQGHLPRAQRVFYADAIGTMAGGFFGTSPMTTYLESAAGVSAGGRSGLTALVIAFLFFIFLFLYPLAQSIPVFATAPALLLIGAQMLAPLAQLPMDDPVEMLGVFLVVLLIPLTFSIATGLAIALVIYPLIKLLAGRAREVHWLLWLLALLCALKLTFIPL